MSTLVISFFRFVSKKAADTFAQSIKSEGWTKVRVVPDAGSGSPPDYIVEAVEPSFREKQIYETTNKKKRTR